MELELAIIFILFIVLILWEIKADFYLILFGIAAYFFILIYVITSKPFTTIPSIINFLFLNPIVIIFILSLLIITFLSKCLKKLNNSKLEGKK